jgi:hypothetical protein
MAIEASPLPFFRAWSWIGRAWIAARGGSDDAERLFERADGQLALVGEGEQSHRELLLMESFVLRAKGFRSAYQGDVRSALVMLRRSLTILDEVDLYTWTRIEGGLRLTGACQILLGMPIEALDTVAELDDYGLAVYDGSDIRALAHLDRGDVDAAVPHLRTHCERGRTGRYPGQANDSVMLLAAMAHAEGDTSRARSLLTAARNLSTDASVVYGRDLARRLDCRTTEMCVPPRLSRCSPNSNAS